LQLHVSADEFFFVFTDLLNFVQLFDMTGEGVKTCFVMSVCLCVCVSVCLQLAVTAS